MTSASTQRGEETLQLDLMFFGRPHFHWSAGLSAHKSAALMSPVISRVVSYLISPGHGDEGRGFICISGPGRSASPTTIVVTNLEERDVDEMSSAGIDSGTL